MYVTEENIIRVPGLLVMLMKLSRVDLALQIWSFCVSTSCLENFPDQR